MCNGSEKALGRLDEPESEYQKRRKERRRLFFAALGIPDDGRHNPMMTRDEFFAFGRTRKSGNLNWMYLRGKTLVDVFYECRPFVDVSYLYCFEDDTVYENRYNVGD